MIAKRSLEDQLDEIWLRHLPATRRQIDQVVDALLDISRGASEGAARESACNDAHQLIGTASTFGRAQLADLARVAERLLRTSQLSDVEMTELVDVAGQLDRMTIGP